MKPSAGRKVSSVVPSAPPWVDAGSGRRRAAGRAGRLGRGAACGRARRAARRAGAGLRRRRAAALAEQDRHRADGEQQERDDAGHQRQRRAAPRRLGDAGRRSVGRHRRGALGPARAVPPADLARVARVRDTTLRVRPWRSPSRYVGRLRACQARSGTCARPSSQAMSSALNRAGSSSCGKCPTPSRSTRV